MIDIKTEELMQINAGWPKSVSDWFLVAGSVALCFCAPPVGLAGVVICAALM